MKQKLKRKYNKIFVVLAWVLAMTFCAQSIAFAEDATKDKYISECIIITNKYIDAAKEEGYTILDNFSLYTGNDESTYLAIKTTNDPDEAITSIRTMNMNGSYRFAEYTNAIERQRDGINSLVSSIKIAINEYRENYEKEKSGALLAKKMLNNLYDEDQAIDGDASTALLGDLFLKDIDDKKLEEMLLGGSIESVRYVFEALLLACNDTRDESFLVTMGNPEFNASAYEKKEEYSSDINKVIDSLGELQGYVKFYEQSGFAGDEKTEKQINAYLESLTEENQNKWQAGKQIENALKECRYRGYKETQNAKDKTNANKNGYQYSTLYDLFMKHDISAGEKGEYQIKDFAPLVECLSPGQRALLEMGVSQVILLAFAMQDTIEGSMPPTYGGGEEVTSPISIYAGVNRSIFQTEDIAVVSDAIRNTSISKLINFAKRESEAKSGLARLTPASFSLNFLKEIIGESANDELASSSAVSIGAALTTNKMLGVESMTRGSAYTKIPSVISSEEAVVDEYGKLTDEFSFVLFEGVKNPWLDKTKAPSTNQEEEEEATVEATEETTAETTQESTATLEVEETKATEPTTASQESTAALTVKNETKKVKESTVAVADEKKADTVTAVTAPQVENLTLPVNEDKIMDIYDWSLDMVGREWICLYATKDARAGKPILANSFDSSSDEDVAGGVIALSMLGSNTATNIYEYSNSDDSENFRIITYKWDENLITKEKTSSIFTDAKTYLIGGVGILLGLTVGFGIFRAKKHEKE